MSSVSFDNYNISGDVGVIAICAVIFILLLTSYVSRTRSFHMFINIVFSLVVAAGVNIAYHGLLAQNNPALYSLVYVFRILYQALLFDVFFLFSLYITEVSGMAHREARITAIVSSLLLFAIVGIDVVRTIMGVGFRIAADGTVVHRTNLFMIGYVLYIAFLAVLMRRVQGLLFKRVMYGFYAVMGVSVVIRFGQLSANQSSLTTMTFVFPVIAMLYIMHSNPYNVTLGSVDIHAMEDMVRRMHSRKVPFLYLSFHLPEYDEEGKELPKELRPVIRRFATEYLRNGTLFQIGNGHIILMVSKRRNPDYEERVRRLLEDFQPQFQRFKKPYKFVIGESMEEISQKNEYASLVKSVEQSMEENTVHWVGEADIARFNQDEYILQQLTDIYNKRDLDDPRVLAFCQPVYNLKTGQFDTAEALMRLELKETGLVFPDRFIPMAESHGFIHVLTEIILHKTSRTIHKLMEEGYRISRISVNVSVLELKEEQFCSDITGIIEDNDVSGNKIAIELTESRNEADFMLMKEKIKELRRQGIQFYLDDFGTGYSNMERIMELPFDIIKFDRSLVIASGTGERSEKIVENLAHVFKDMDYTVLYEGVEDETDEERCREMSATYLQGYKYSRPVPIEQLRRFLPKAG